MARRKSNALTFLTWHKFYDNDGERSYTIRHPTWNKVLAVFNRLDSEGYPSFFGYFTGHTKPNLLVIGGPTGYFIGIHEYSTNGRLTKSISYLHSRATDQEDLGELRDIGKGYHCYQIEEKLLTDEHGVIIDILTHIVHHGTWPTTVRAHIQSW